MKTAKRIDLPGPRVFILGAGATRAGFKDISVPPPIDHDFFNIAGQIRGRGTSKAAIGVLQNVWRLYSRINAVGLEEYYRDIETRRLIQNIGKSPGHPMDWEKRIEDLEELIRRVFLHTTCDTSGKYFRPRVSDIHKVFLDALQKGDIIITFNYDLAIEQSFSSARLWNPIDGYGMEVFGVRSPWFTEWLAERSTTWKGTVRSGLTILKLHGSLNWKRDLLAGRVSLKDKPYWVRAQNGNPIPQRVGILPPSWNKPINKRPFRALWRQARNALFNARTIVMIGYSLPETDLLALAMFAEVVRTRSAANKPLDQLHLAEPIQAVREKFITLFNSALAAQGKVFQYHGFEEFMARRAAYKVPAAEINDKTQKAPKSPEVLIKSTARERK